MKGEFDSLHKYQTQNRSTVSVNGARSLAAKCCFLFNLTIVLLSFRGDKRKILGIFSPYPVEDFAKRIVYWHVVKLIGWGQYNNGQHYWLAVNSFGRHWGDSGESPKACFLFAGLIQYQNDFK